MSLQDFVDMLNSLGDDITPMFVDDSVELSNVLNHDLPPISDDEEWVSDVKESVEENLVERKGRV